jgi:hypothetical protein
MTMTDGHLNDLLEKITDGESFLEFARALEEDRRNAVIAEEAHPIGQYGPDAGGWESGSIEDFLEAAVAWAEASNFGLKQGLSPANPWKQFGVFLYSGKHYE